MGMYDKDEYDSNDGDGLSEMGSQHCGSTITSAPGTTLREMERRMSSRRAGGAATIATATTTFLAPPPRRPASSFHGSVGGGSGNGGKTNKNMSNRNHGRTVVSPHQETKDSVISDPENHDDPQDDDDSQARSYYSRDSFSTRDPEGVYDDDSHNDDGPPNTVEEYAAMARRRASRMTHVNFDRHRRRPHDGALAIVAPHGGTAEGTVAGRSVTSRSSSTGSRSERRAKRRARVEKSKDDLLQRYDEEMATTTTATMHHPEPDPDPERRRQDSRKNHSFVGNGDVDLLDSHPADHNALAVIPVHAPADEAAGGGGPPPIHPSNPQTMVGSHILAPSSDASTSSTVSSITSVDSYMRQQILLKELEKYKKEREWMRREREEGRRRKATTVLVEEDEEEEGEGDYEYEYEYDDREEHDDDDEEEAFHKNGRERTRTRGASIASPRSRPPEQRHRNDHRRHPATGTRARSLTPTRQQQRRRQRQPDTASRSVKSFHSPTMHNHRYPPSPHRPSWQSQSQSHSRSPSRSSRGNRTRDSRSSGGGWGSYISGASENTSYYSDDEESTYYYHHRNHPSASASVSPPHSNQSTSFRSGTSSPPPPPSRHRRRRSSSRSTATRSHRSSSKSRTSSRASDATAATPPVYQLEECCIKHPDVLLSDQTDVRVWTCMRYCKDEKSGRWITVKKVCRVCLDEMEGGERSGGGGGGYEHDGDDNLGSYGGRDAPEEGSYYARHHGSRIRRSSHSNDRSHPSNYYDSSTSSSSSWNHDERHLHHHPHDDGTASLTDSRYYDDDDDAAIMKDTINVHPTFGEDGNQTPLEREAEAQRRRFIRRLAARAYHFPGNTWCEDWMQYMSNTHLVLGIFFHHPLHPVTGRERCIILLGSVAVGLLMSNLIYLWFVHANIDTDEAVISIGIDSLNVTKLMITLWTLGSVVHTLFDLSVWHIKACTLCRYGGNVSDEAMKCGRTAGVTIVLSTLAFATYLVLLRASSDYNKEMKLQLAAMGDFESNEQEEEEETANVFFESISLAGGAQSFDFLAGYIIEFILAVFVYNPLILTVVFTGMLGCNGRIPVLGGRPREVAKEQRYAMKRQRYTMPQTLKLGDEEFEADMWGDANQKLATNF